MATKLKLDPDTVVVATTSGVTLLASGEEASFRRGQKFRAAAPVVRKLPHFFVPESTPVDEWPSEYAAADVSLAAQDREYRVEQARREPAPIPAERRVYASSSIVADGRTFSAGVVYDSADPVVRKNAQYFEVRRPMVPS
jgi:hypothetical protein